MKYDVYQLHFTTAVHFGDGVLSDSLNTFRADTFFSALCHEALKRGGEAYLKEWVHLFHEGRLRFSDAMPYAEEILFLPKPLKPFLKEKDSEIVDKKAVKKLKYIPAHLFEDYVNHGLTEETLKASDLDLGRYAVNQHVAIRGQEETLPYTVGTFRYNDHAGVYILLASKDKVAKDFFEDLLKSLSYVGIGGKIRSGLGKFSYEIKEFPAELKKRLGTDSQKMKMTLSTSLPKSEELDEAIKGSYYLLEKRSGFVSSEKYHEDQKRKEDLFVFKKGSCFSFGFEGDIFDVAREGNHPVYRYAYPLFMEVE